VRSFGHLRDNNAKETNLISSFWDHIGKDSLTDTDICVAIRRAVILLDLQKNKITSARLGTHSFQSGGGMAFKFAGANRDNIKNGKTVRGYISNVYP